MARNISIQSALIGALLARGRWASHYVKDSNAALSDLTEALGQAISGGYRIYEADIRTGIAWVHLAEGDPSGARAEAERVRQMSAEMSYHWGQIEAVAVFDVLDRQG